MNLDDDQLEKELSAQVVELAKMLGYDYIHLRPAQTKHGWRTPVEGTLGKGWPDWQFIRPKDGRVLYRELKKQDGKVSDDQAWVLVRLRAAGLDAEVWRPRDFSSGRILLELEMSDEEWRRHRRLPGSFDGQPPAGTVASNGRSV